MYNYHKQQKPDGTVQLVSTTYQSPIAYEDGKYSGMYQSMEISVNTPDDKGEQIEIEFDTRSTVLNSPLPELICIREVEEK